MLSAGSIELIRDLGVNTQVHPPRSYVTPPTRYALPPKSDVNPPKSYAGSRNTLIVNEIFADELRTLRIRILRRWITFSQWHPGYGSSSLLKAFASRERETLSRLAP